MSDSPMLVDTSAWIAALRNGAPEEMRNKVESALSSGRAAMTGAIRVELYHSVRGKLELERLRRLHRLCRWLDFDDDCRERAAAVARQCREKGTAVPLGDDLVFA